MLLSAAFQSLHAGAHCTGVKHLSPIGMHMQACMTPRHPPYSSGQAVQHWHTASCCSATGQRGWDGNACCSSACKRGAASAEADGTRVAKPGKAPHPNEIWWQVPWSAGCDGASVHGHTHCEDCVRRLSVQPKHVVWNRFCHILLLCHTSPLPGLPL